MNAFEQITKSPEVLGEFLRGLPVIEAPWDREFQERFCADCLYLNCDGCPHEEYTHERSGSNEQGKTAHAEIDGPGHTANGL